MDMPRNDVRPVDLDSFSTPKHLEHAAQQARKRNYQDFLIVDVDSHHYENESYAEVFEYIENPVMRRERDRQSAAAARMAQHTGRRPEPRRGASSATKAAARQAARREAPRHRPDARLDGLDGRRLLLPVPDPDAVPQRASAVEVEVAMAQAYNRWLCERILAHEPRIVSMLYLPFNDPDAAYRR